MSNLPAWCSGIIPVSGLAVLHGISAVVKALATVTCFVLAIGAPKTLSVPLPAYPVVKDDCRCDDVPVKSAAVGVTGPL